MVAVNGYSGSSILPTAQHNHSPIHTIMEQSTFFSNNYNRIFTVRLLYAITQPIVFGTLDEIVKYAILPNNGIEGFYEVEGIKLRKVSKKQLKEMLSNQFPELEIQLFKKY